MKYGIICKKTDNRRQRVYRCLPAPFGQVTRYWDFSSVKIGLFRLETTYLMGAHSSTRTRSTVSPFRIGRSTNSVAWPRSRRWVCRWSSCIAVDLAQSDAAGIPGRKSRGSRNEIEPTICCETQWVRGHLKEWIQKLVWKQIKLGRPASSVIVRVSPGAVWEVRRAPGRLSRPWVLTSTPPVHAVWKTMISGELLSPITPLSEDRKCRKTNNRRSEPWRLWLWRQWSRRWPTVHNLCQLGSRRAWQRCWSTLEELLPARLKPEGPSLWGVRKASL